MTRGLIIAAPSSGSGKTLCTLSLLALLRQKGLRVAGCKAGPDYIDPAFHAVATGQPCVNLDIWGMRKESLLALLTQQAARAELLIIEGAMGLYDGIGGLDRASNASCAQLARTLNLPVVLIMNAKGQGQTAGAIIEGLIAHDPAVKIAGVIFNNVGSKTHREILASAAQAAGVPVFGYLPFVESLKIPSRHLGLVQAREMELSDFLAAARIHLADAFDLEAMIAAAAELTVVEKRPQPLLPPLGQRIALADDDAFAFTYPFHRESWIAAGAEILPFSPLNDDAPSVDADAIFLPGGYPELYAGRLAGNHRFLKGLRAAAARDAFIYGECGGYMTLGSHLVDAQGVAHEMAGLLPVATSFATRKLHLGYRALKQSISTPLGKQDTLFRGHEFHYATILEEGVAPALFAATDARGRDLGLVGRRVQNVMGSFIHLIDLASA